MPITRKRGRYWYGFVRVDGVSSDEQSTGCGDRQAAETVLRQWERDAADPHRAAKKRATLDDALARMIESCEELAKTRPPKLAQSTVEMYEKKAAVLKTVFLALDEPVTHLWQISRESIRRYVSFRRALGISEHTIDKEFTTLRKTLELARAYDEWDGHWDDLVPEGFSPGYEPQRDFLRPVQLQALLAHLGPDNAARAAFMVGTGAEWSATETTRREDCREDFVHVGGTKNETRDREVPLVRPWQRELVNYALEYAMGKDGLLFRPNTSFTHALYRACDCITTTRAIASVMAFLRWAPAPAELGPYEVFPRISSHDLRRTFGTWLRADGVAVSEVAAMLGHADSRMAERVYAKLPPDLLRDLLSEFCQPAAGNGLPKAGTGGHSRHCAAPRLPLEMVPRGGIEPPTRGFSVPCSTD